MCAPLCLTLWPPQTVARQAPLPMEFSRQGYWNGLPFPPPGDLPDPGIKPESPALAAGFLTLEPPGKPTINLQHWPILNWLFLWTYLLPLSLEIKSLPLYWHPSHPSNGWSLPDLMLFPIPDTHSFFTNLHVLRDAFLDHSVFKQPHYAPDTTFYFASQHLQLPHIFAHISISPDRMQSPVLYTAIWPEPGQFLQHCGCSKQNVWAHKTTMEVIDWHSK